MASTVVRAPAEAAPFAEAFARIRTEFEVPVRFPDDVEAEAATSAQRGPLVPHDVTVQERCDARDVAFVTIDPPGSRDLDQAFHAERRGDGFRVRYAIADVMAFVAPGGAVDRESFERGVTVYLPDGRAPQVPTVLSEGAASLLAGEDRPALLWTLDLDSAGATTSARPERATVRSRAALDYPSVQTSLDAGRADEPLVLVREVGKLRQALEAARGGISLDLPTQDVVPTSEGGYDLRYEAPLPVEDWNAQISLLAGMEAAKIMIDAHVGILRTLPAPEQWQVDRLRRSARALGVAWSTSMPWPDVVRNLDRRDPNDAAFLIQAAHVLRGAGYTKLDVDNTRDDASVPIHAAVAAPYAHVTAPLRRLADRYGNEIVLAHCAGRPIPDWVGRALDEVVTVMQAATERNARVERAVLDAVECALLASGVGKDFEGVVVDQNDHGVIVQLTQPAVVAPLKEHLPLGSTVTVTVVGVDPIARRIQLRTAGSSRAR